jgi:hypothetical protein
MYKDSSGQRHYFVNGPDKIPEISIPENHYHVVTNGTEHIRRTIKNRNQQMKDMVSMAADKTIMSGQSRINGAGEVLLNVSFACKFGEKPLFYFGGEIIEQKSIAEGKFPTISAFVCGWNAQERVLESEDPNLAPYSRFFTGATIGVVTTGNPHSKFVLHWHFIGDAVAGPDGSVV